MSWITSYQRLWERRLDGLELFLTLRRGTRDDDTKGPAS